MAADPDGSRLAQHRDRPQAMCGEVNQMLDTHIAQVEEQIASLRSLEVMLRELRSRCGEQRKAGECGILGLLGQGSDRTASLRDEE